MTDNTIAVRCKMLYLNQIMSPISQSVTFVYRLYNMFYRSL